jgi:regulator of replication initiation timing
MLYVLYCTGEIKMKAAKFDFSDYSVLDEIYSETGRKPKYREVLEKLRQLVSSGYSPSHKSVYAYIDAWRLDRFGDSQSFGDSQIKKQNIISDSHILTEKLSQIASQVSEFEFLKLQVSSLEEQNRQLLIENEKLRGKIEGFEQAIESLKSLISQRDIDIISQVRSIFEEKEKEEPSKSAKSDLEPEFLPEWFLEFRHQCLLILQKSGRSELENYLNTFTVARLHDFSALISPTDKPPKRSTKLKFVSFLISQFESI